MHPFLLRRDQAVLVIIDVQERLHAEMAGREQVESNLVKLAEATRTLGLPVVLTEHAPNALGATLPAVRTSLAHYTPLEKISFSCFGSEDFRTRLGTLGRRQVVVAGYEAHVCVCQTALDAQAAGYQVHLVRDATASRSEKDRAVGLDKMSAAGVLPASTESVMFELLGRAGTDEFRALLPTIKRK